MGQDEYLDKFYDLLDEGKEKGKKGTRIKNIREGREAYKKGRSLLRESYTKTGYSTPPDYNTFRGRAQALGQAKELLSEGQETGNLDPVISAIELYENLGKSNKYIKNKILDAVQEYFRRHGSTDNNALKEIETFLKNPSTKKSKNLERKVAAATAMIGIIGGLFFLSPILTGNAIGNITNNTSNLIGGILFVLGIVGSFVYFKRR